MLDFQKRQGPDPVWQLVRSLSACVEPTRRSHLQAGRSRCPDILAQKSQDDEWASQGSGGSASEICCAKGFVGHWNSLQLPLIYLQKKELQTLPMAILSLFNPQQTRQPWTLIMATSLLAVVPLVIVFLLVQRYFVESIVLTWTKG